MDVKVTIKLTGIFGIVALLFILTYLFSQAGNGGWAIVFFISAIVVLVLFLIRGHSGD